MQISIPGTGIAGLGRDIQNNGEVERWYTVRETAILCHRPEGTSR